MKKIIDGEYVITTLDNGTVIRELKAAEQRLPEAPSKALITRFAFRKRFTTLEKITIDMAAIDNPAAADAIRQMSASVRVHLADLSSADRIDLKLPLTRDGVQSMEAFGLIAPGRAAAILDSPIQPEERADV